jgi:fatty acid amide hydrolase 2
MTPPDDLRLASATALAAAIARKELRAVEVVDAHIAHARAVNPTLNAIVVERFAAARAEAEAADAHQEAGHPLPPLHGVPCTIKESFAFAGMPNCAGLVSRAAYRSPADAITVARLRGAGAIPLGLTNTSELCMWLESDNRVYGRTNNPYQSAHIVGGSSGGEGAIVGSGASPFGLGSDVGGSIRLPAFFNGVFGHKCSPGLIPNSGQFPSANGAEAEGMLSTGPLCRKAVDLWPLLRILAGPDLPAALRRDPATEALAGLRVVLLPRPTWRDPQPAQAAAVLKAGEALKGRGAAVSEGSLPGLRKGFLLWGNRLGAGNVHSFHELLGGEGPPPPLARELWRLFRGQSAHTPAALGLALVEKVPLGDPAANVRALDALQAELLALIGPRGVLLQPTFPRVAPRHGQPLLRFWEAGYTGIYNALGLPVTQVPTGLDGDGLPTGLQVVGAPGEDALCVAVAQALEADLGGWVPPWQAARA